MMIHGKVEPTDIYDMKKLLYIQEAQMDKFSQELASPSATTNVAQAIVNSNSDKNGNSGGSQHHFCGRGRIYLWQRAWQENMKHRESTYMTIMQ